MKVYEAIAEALRREGVGQVFGLMGDANMSLWCHLVERGIARIHAARNEAGAVAMADGWFRATGRTGIATVTCGPGLTQIGTSLMAAARNRSSLLVVTGEWPGQSPNGLQCMDQRRFVEACETRYIACHRADTLARDIAQAFHLARGGPVVLSVANDLQEAAAPEGWTYSPAPPAAAPQGAAPEALEGLVAALRGAERPVLLAGRGAARAGAREQVRALAERVGALLGTTLQVKGMFSDQPWSIGVVGGYAAPVTEQLCAEADLVVGIGAEIGHYTSWANTLFPQARLIRIDNRAPRETLPAAGGETVTGDAALVLGQVLEALGNGSGPGFRTPGVQALLQQEAPHREEAGGGLAPRALARRLGAWLTPDMRLTVGVGHFQGFAAMHMPVPAGLPVEFSSAFGAVGQTLPLAIGIGHAFPGTRQLVIEGDGSLMMNIQELDGAARSGIDMTLAVWNDCGYGAEAQRLPGKGFDPAPATWTSPDFAAIARGFGGEGATVKTPDQLEEALETARGARGLFLLDLRVSPAERSDTYRKLFYGEPNRAPLLA